MNVAIIGQPNVGKSSLFNRIIGRKKAIVEPSCGVTRDRLIAKVLKKGRSFSLIDTGGFDPSQKDKISRLVSQQARQALDEAEVIVLVCDAVAGLTDLDKQVAQLIRQSQKSVILTVNKADSEKLCFAAAEFYSLGIGEPLCISAAQGKGIDELIGRIIEYLPQEAHEELKDTIKVAIVGRPNVGKSSFVNKLLNEERVIVDHNPGTTRDAIDTEFSLKGKNYTLIDTAGMQRKSKIKNSIDFYGFARAEYAIERCDVALVLIDASCGLTNDDIRAVGLVLEKYKGCVLVVNKWDLVAGTLTEDYEKHLRTRMKFLHYVPMVFISALTGKRVDKAIILAAEVDENTRFEITTGRLNKFWGDLYKKNPPAVVKNKLPKINYFTQTGIKPPSFVAFSNHPRLIRKSYTSFLENNLRREFGLSGTPVKISYRAKKTKKESLR